MNKKRAKEYIVKINNNFFYYMIEDTGIIYPVNEQLLTNSGCIIVNKLGCNIMENVDKLEKKKWTVSEQKFIKQLVDKKIIVN